ncbi:hypothetical protein JW805_12275 [Roseomonas aeriglobus]|nr:hypothetical protein [Roseomonas aeriglobus]
MIETLLNPDNRLLTWSINDLGLYGAALTPATVSAAEQRREYFRDDSARPATSSDTSLHPGGAAGGPPFELATGSDRTTVTDDGPDGPVATAAVQPTMLPLPALSAPAISTLATSAPTDLSMGSTTGVFVPAPVPPPTAPTLVSTSPIDPATTLSAPVLATGSVVDTATLTVPGLVGQTQTLATDTVEGVVPAVAQTAPPLVEAAADTVQAATETLADAAATTAATLDAAVDDIATRAEQAADGALDPVMATADGIIAPAVAPVVDALAATEIPDTASALIETAATSTTDLLSGVGGTDPAGGVATLVDIVAAADEFDLSHVDAAPVADTGSIVDLLAVDLDDAPLLGAGDDDHGPTDDESHGLLGLGL